MPNAAFPSLPLNAIEAGQDIDNIESRSPIKFKFDSDAVAFVQFLVAANALQTYGLAAASQAEAEAGTSITLLAWTPERVKQSILALATIANITGLAAALAAKAPLASPALTGTPTAPTAVGGTMTTQLATCLFVTTEIANGGFATLAGPAFTGIPTAPTASTPDSSTQLATTEFVHNVAGTKADIDGPALTGVPSAPTASLGTNTTQIATTEFVVSQVGAAVAPLAPLDAPSFTGNATAPTKSTGDNSTAIATTAFIVDALASLSGAWESKTNDFTAVAGHSYIWNFDYTGNVVLPATPVEGDAIRVMCARTGGQIINLSRNGNLINDLASDYPFAAPGIAWVVWDSVASTWRAIIYAPNTFLSRSVNLMDLPNAGDARANLGLDSAAIHPESYFLQADNNLGDVSSVPGAIANLGLATWIIGVMASFANDILANIVTASELDLLMGGVVKVAGVQVVGAQQANIPDSTPGDVSSGVDSVDLADLNAKLTAMQATINAHLASDKMHGLIASA